uniref:Apolipoprotein M n=1 Tax=Myripristis murdjan TaxID=586833 RepID=A0A667YJD2_9TELE
MCVRFSVCFLLAGLYLSSSAPTPEDCDPLLTPLPLDDRTKLLGRWNFIAGFTDSEMFDSILKTVNSSWINFTSSPSTVFIKSTTVNSDQTQSESSCRKYTAGNFLLKDSSHANMRNVFSFHFLSVNFGH